MQFIYNVHKTKCQAVHSVSLSHTFQVVDGKHSTHVVLAASSDPTSTSLAIFAAILSDSSR